MVEEASRYKVDFICPIGMPTHLLLLVILY